MASRIPSEIERSVRSALEADDLQRAATEALQELGPDVQRFLSARLHDRPQAEEAYLQFSEDLWVGLPGFRWQSSLRAWMFVLARNAATRVSRKQQREVQFDSGRHDRTNFYERVRTSTARFLRTEVKDRMRKIRERLDEDDQTLLILRVDRKLEWSDLAVVMNEVSIDAPAADVQRAAARLRTRFQTAKKRLRALAEAEGLLPRRPEEQ
jgi:RNA polymerase sigma-70 factor, ECF subfamily